MKKGLKEKTPAPFGTGVPGVYGATPVGSLARIFEPFGGKVEKLSPGVAVKDGNRTGTITGGPTSDRKSEAGTILRMIGTETEVVIVTGGTATLFVVGLSSEKENDSLVTESFVGRHKVKKIPTAKPRRVNDGGTTPTTLEIRTREPRRNVGRSVEDAGTLSVHTENDTTGVRGGEDGDVATGGKRGSHCVSRFFVSALEHS